MNSVPSVEDEGMRLEEYRANLRVELQPILEAVLLNLLKWRPYDAIEFIGLHLRHLRVNNQNSLSSVRYP